jgi:hypothetical protein
MRGHTINGNIEEELERFMIEAGFAYYDSDIMFLNQGLIAVA